MIFSKYLQLALPHMRQMVRARFNCPITIELLEQLPLPTINSGNNGNHSTPAANPSVQLQMTNNNTVVSQSILSQQQQQSSSTIVQQPLYTTVQTQQKINILQSSNQPSLIGNTGSLLSQQHQQQQQARAQVIGLNQVIYMFSLFLQFILFYF